MSKLPAISLKSLGIEVHEILRNPSPARLYECAIEENDGQIVSSGALAVHSGEKMGRSPRDKRVVEQPDNQDDIWWGDVNLPLAESSFEAIRRQAVNGLNARRRLYVIDGFAGWDPKYRIKVRIVCARPYHALFMWNMLIRPTAEELADYGEPDFTIINSGQCAADPAVEGITSTTSVALNFGRQELVILGTQYAGEMKKGVFTVMHYLMPKTGVLSMHCSANDAEGQEVALFFGLSGTGKTTLSADPRRCLIGDDEHCWSDEGVFNIEGGCYAKCIDLSREKEPEIFEAIRFGAVLENVVYDPVTREVDYADSALTENTRASYPIEFIPHAEIPCTGGHPKNILFLTCDAFGVMPPVARLTPEQAMYHFINGYTAKVAGTEVGVTEPEATFSACYGAAFLVWHPTKYAELLAAKMRRHGSRAWLVNTGWSGGPHGVGARIRLKHTRSIIDAIHDGALDDVPTEPDPVFALAIPKSCPHVPSEILVPRNTWTDKSAFDQTARKLAGLFQGHFQRYSDQASEATKAAGPKMVE